MEKRKDKFSVCQELRGWWLGISVSPNPTRESAANLKLPFHQTFLNLFKVWLKLTMGQEGANIYITEIQIENYKNQNLK
jgi:hypothetical protein